ncbi:MAG TPA: redox-regulated ATPase YchF, partial [candidate division CPR3 bacterium]|nr:redox-regulated ATPase YchF [candidate division CPR3 bacterium]
PNVGKSTLFNALTKNQVPAENYPFNTIEPNVGVVPVSDERLEKLAEVEKPEKIVPAVIKFVDIAGLVKGAHKGEGLGNQFLASIREVDAIVHVVRAFQSSDVTHVEGRIDPKDDVEIIETELVLKDLETVEKKLKKIERDRGIEDEIKEWIKGLFEHLGEGKLTFGYNQELRIKNEELGKLRQELSLLTDKPVIHLINEAQEKHSDSESEYRGAFGGETLMLDVKLESELSELNDTEKEEYLKELGMKESGFEQLTRLAYKTLGLISFFTSGPKEVRAWTVKKGALAPQAAGVIHTDFEKNFIAADVVSYSDFVKYGGWEGARDKGKVGLEGKEYVVRDGDVVLFRHGN